jgi:hypothetical protein
MVLLQGPTGWRFLIREVPLYLAGASTLFARDSQPPIQCHGEAFCFQRGAYVGPLTKQNLAGGGDEGHGGDLEKPTPIGSPQA